MPYSQSALERGLTAPPEACPGLVDHVVARTGVLTAIAASPCVAYGEQVALLSVPTSSRRALASVGDLGVIACWIGVLSLVSLVVRSVLPSDTADVSSVPLPAIDLGAFAITVLPVGCYLVATEAGRRRASFGKRWQGLQVATATGAAPGWRRVLARTAVKLLPWQLAHLSVSRFITGADLSPAIWVAYGASFVLVVGTVVTALRDPAGRALHDRIAGTRVVVRGDHPRRRVAEPG